MSYLCMCIVSCVVFFKQKTAYEMRISDWSSDVCSSDLLGIESLNATLPEIRRSAAPLRVTRPIDQADAKPVEKYVPTEIPKIPVVQKEKEIGRASCRERVCQYV